LNELEPEMIKYLKLARYLSVVLAVSTVVFAGIGLIRVNETVSERADFLDKPNVIEQLREIEIPKGNEDKTPPLVTQAIAFSLRIKPPKPKLPPIQLPVDSTRKTLIKKSSVVEKASEEIDRFAPFKLLATCVHENHPEKSLAMIDFTSKGSRWVRQGDTIGYKVIHQVNDGNIVLYQGGKKSGILEVPKKNAVSSLLKSSGTTITAAAPAYSGRTSTDRPVKRDSSATTGNPAFKRPLRSLPARQSLEEAKKAADRNTDELKAILDNIDTKPRDGSGDKGGGEDLMKAVMQMLESSSKNAEAKKAEAKKAEAMKAKAKKTAPKKKNSN